MNEKLNLKDSSKFLLTLDPNYDYNSKELDHFEDLADELISQYGWSTVYKEWSRFLHEKCPTDGA